jgi:copper ion binding protein
VEIMKKTFNVKGMHCKSCELIIKESIGDVDGVSNVDVSLIKNTVTVDYDDEKVKDTMIKKIIESEGYYVRS